MLQLLHTGRLDVFLFFPNTIQADCFSNQKDKMDRMFLIMLIITNVSHVEKNLHLISSICTGEVIFSLLNIL